MVSSLAAYHNDGRHEPLGHFTSSDEIKFGTRQGRQQPASQRCVQLRRCLVDAVLADDLGDQVVLVLERAEFPLEKLAPRAPISLRRILLRLDGMSSAECICLLPAAIRENQD